MLFNTEILAGQIIVSAAQLVKSQAFAGVTEVDCDLTAVFAADANAGIWIIFDCTFSATADLWLRYSTTGGAPFLTSADHRSTIQTLRHENPTGSNQDDHLAATRQELIDTSQSASSVSDRGVHFMIHLSSMFDATQRTRLVLFNGQYFRVTAGVGLNLEAGGIKTGLAAHNAFRILPSTGTITGKITVLAMGTANNAGAPVRMIDEKVAAASASLTLDLDTSFRRHFALIDGLRPAVDGDDLRFRFRTGGAPITGATDYFDEGRVHRTDGSNAFQEALTQAFVRLSEPNGVGNAAAEGLGGVLWINNGGGAGARVATIGAHLVSDEPTDDASRFDNGAGLTLSGISAVNECELFYNGGNIAEGRVRVYAMQ